MKIVHFSSPGSIFTSNRGGLTSLLSVEVVDKGACVVIKSHTRPQHEGNKLEFVWKKSTLFRII